MTRDIDRQTKAGDASDEQPWPRVVPFGSDAINWQPPTSDLVAKSDKHKKKLEAELATCEQRLNDAMRAVYEQEIAASKADTNGPMVITEPYVAPANDDRIEAEAALNAVRARLGREERIYKAKQTRALLGIPEPSLLDRAKSALLG